MRAFVPVLLAVTALGACTRENPRPPAAPVVAPPAPQGTWFDEEGVERTVVRVEGMLRYGGRDGGEMPDEGVLLGYEFEAHAGDRPVIELTIEEGAGETSVSLHGPRDRIGLWHAALGAATGGPGAPAVLDDVALEQPGHYLILLQGRGAAGARYAVRLGCDGECAPPDCPDTAPCDLVCRDGFEADGLACRLCECIAPGCTPGDCPEGEVCGDDGRCRPEAPDCAASCPREFAPVCAGGETYPNACLAECAGARDPQPGSCGPPPPPACGDGDPCPEGLVCREGRCVEPPCDCPPVYQPVCGVDGATYGNRCRLECALGPEGFAYHGECVRGRCESEEDCPDDWRCVPAASVPENRTACRPDPRAPECIRHCAPPSRDPTCAADRRCPAGLHCLRAPDAPVGLCLPVCHLESGRGCPEGTVCVNLHPRAAERGMGLCAPACADGGRCRARLVCGQDLDGRTACLPGGCRCPEPGPHEAVCTADGETFPSPCHARCAGYDRFRRGPCPDDDPGDPPPPGPDCRCEPRPGFVCAADGRIYASECEARCHGQRLDGAWSCLQGEPLARRCETDEDCFRTGCGDLFCASAESDACAPLSPLAHCVATEAECGCNHGVCALRPTAAVLRCFRSARPLP